MCKALDTAERLKQQLDRTMNRSKYSLRERLKKRSDEFFRLHGNTHFQDCSDCRDEEDARLLIKDIEHEAWYNAAYGSYEVKRSFTWAHFEKPCGEGCQHPPLSLHGVTVLTPSHLKGLAKVLWNELVGPEMDLTVEIVDVSTAMYGAFRFKIRWE